MMKAFVVVYCLWCTVLTIPSPDETPQSAPVVDGNAITNEIQRVFGNLFDLPLFTNPQKVFQLPDPTMMEIPNKTYSIEHLCENGFEAVYKQCPRMKLQKRFICRPYNRNKLLVIGCSNSHENKSIGDKNGGFVLAEERSFMEIVSKSKEDIEKVSHETDQTSLQDKLVETVPSRPIKEIDVFPENRVRVLRVNRDVDQDQQRHYNNPIQKRHKHDGPLLDYKYSKNSKEQLFKNFGTFWTILLIVAAVKLVIVAAIFAYMFHANAKRIRDENQLIGRGENSEENKGQRIVSFIDSPKKCLEHPI